MTEKELEKTYSEYSVDELLAVLSNRGQYTDIAIKVALKEAARRNVAPGVVRKHADAQREDTTIFIEENMADDISFPQRFMFFFLWGVPFLVHGTKGDFEKEGKMMKLRLANYYYSNGIILFVIAFIITMGLHLSAIPALALWVLMFAATYAYEKVIYRKRVIRNLQKQLDELHNK